MTIPYRILIGEHLSLKEKEVINKIIVDTFDEVDRIYNKWNPHSEISQLNQLKAGILVSISPEMETLLNLTNEIVKLTDYKFDPTIEPLQALWKKHLSENKIPSDEEIQHIAKFIGWNHIHFEKGTFHKDFDLTSLDLGGIAKGYCVDLLVKRLNEVYFKNVFVDWGGEIKVSGEHPQKRPWTIFISRFGNKNPEQAIAIIPLKDQAIATSGDYLQNWKSEEDVTYFHIIDRTTLTPRISTKKSVASASVLASSCAFADGLATAAMMFSSIQEAEKWSSHLKKLYPEVQFWLVSHED